MERKNNGVARYRIFHNKNATAGITLVALVITIIVLLILAGVAVVSLTGDNGIIKKAQEAKEKTDNASKEEQNALNNILETMNQIQGGNTGGNNPSVELPKTDETNPYLPDNSFSQLPNTDLNTGLVITDGTNQYVWVEVPKSVTASASTETQIETALQNYASAYKKSGYMDTWYSGCGIASQAEYDTIKNKMLNSIKTYGGFWIGRYEAGTSDNGIRDNSSIATTTSAVAAQDRYPYNFVTISQAQELANRNSTSNYTNSLPFGIQWNLICKYLENKGIEQATIKTNSSLIGNYYGISFTISRGKYSTDRGKNYTSTSGSYTKQSNGDILLTTGCDERNKTMNIYDLAGNEYEWTLEKSNDSNLPCVSRGGSFNYTGDSYALSSRRTFATTWSDCIVSFHQTIFK